MGSNYLLTTLPSTFCSDKNVRGKLLAWLERTSIVEFKNRTVSGPYHSCCFCTKFGIHSPSYTACLMTAMTCNDMRLLLGQASFIRDFMIFGKKEEYSENTIYRTIHFIKTILNFVERKGIRTCVRELELRREKQKKEVVTLTEKEIIKIQKTVVPEERPSKSCLANRVDNHKYKNQPDTFSLFVLFVFFIV